METDYDAQLITINYEGGYIVMPAGNVRSLFGVDPTVLRSEGVEKTVSVKGHTRTRVIGEAATTVAGYNYTYTQWPTTTGAQAAGGEAIEMKWEGSQGSWTARMGGSAWSLGEYLNKNSPKLVSFTTNNGSNYGPFIQFLP